MDNRPLKDQWRYVRLPVTDHDPKPRDRHLKVLAVGKFTVVFGKPKKGQPSEMVMVGTYLISAITWI